MKHYLLVEGVTDVSLVKYICQAKLNINFSDFEKKKGEAEVDTYKYKDFVIIDLKGQNNLSHTLTKIIFPEQQRVEKIGIIQDADDDFDASKESIQQAISASGISNNKIQYFLTPNNKDTGDLETLLLSTIEKNNKIIDCFDDYKICLENQQAVYSKALNKGQIYAYTMYSQTGKNLYKPQDSFIHKNKDTGLWDLNDKKFKPIISFVLSIFS
ncbi:hypothetical protein [uncultured Gammaproteobacteria bacterium]|jgi:hypothetical protein|nr:hypothetical protein [uncultured Gammaproteobacteria bacterium]CAC9625572.1 hypothetical protein [uncultured Gammaproteobacteria bacterium]